MERGERRGEDCRGEGGEVSSPTTRKGHHKSRRQTQICHDPLCVFHLFPASSPAHLTLPLSSAHSLFLSLTFYQSLFLPLSISLVLSLFSLIYFYRAHSLSLPPLTLSQTLTLSHSVYLVFFDGKMELGFSLPLSVYLFFS